MSNYKFISFFTKNTPYEFESIKLKKSLDKLNIDYKIYEVNNLFNWSKNCQQKANVILNALNEFEDKNIIYTDADSQILDYPILFEKINVDFAYHFIDYRNELLSGTLFFKNNDKIRKLIKLWIEKNNTNKQWDQKNLQEVYFENKNKLKISDFILPCNYCKIRDNEFQKCNFNDIIIIHNQASRVYRNYINNSRG